MNSPWGIIFSVIRETKWTMHEVLWKHSWKNIQLMMKDAPGYKYNTGTGNGKKKNGDEDFSDFFNDL